MIWLFALLVPAEGLSVEQFHDHWRHPHGTYGRLVPGFRTYIQAHRVDTDVLGPEQSQYEGVAICEFDSVQERMAYRHEAYYREFVDPDHASFLRPSSVKAVTTSEEVLVPRLATGTTGRHADTLWNARERGTSTQLLQFVQPSGNANWATTADAELGHRLGALRHVRNVPLAEIDGDQPAFIGVRQLWWPTVTAFHDGVRSDPDAFATLLGGAGDAVTLLAQSERFLR